MTHTEYARRQYAHRVKVASSDTGISLKELAPIAKMTYRSLLSKLRLEHEFTQTEMILIQQAFNWNSLEG